MVRVQESDDQGNTWVDAKVSASLSTTGGTVLRFTGPITGLVRANYTVTTGPVAFSVALRYSGAL